MVRDTALHNAAAGRGGEDELERAPDAKEDKDDGDGQKTSLNVDHTWLEHCVSHLSSGLQGIFVQETVYIH